MPWTACSPVGGRVVGLCGVWGACYRLWQLPRTFLSALWQLCGRYWQPCCLSRRSACIGLVGPTWAGRLGPTSSRTHICVCSCSCAHIARCAPAHPLVADMLQKAGPRELLRVDAEVTTPLFPHQMQALAWMVGGACVVWSGVGVDQPRLCCSNE